MIWEHLKQLLFRGSNEQVGAGQLLAEFAKLKKEREAIESKEWMRQSVKKETESLVKFNCQRDSIVVTKFCRGLRKAAEYLNKEEAIRFMENNLDSKGEQWLKDWRNSIAGYDPAVSETVPNLETTLDALYAAKNHN